MIAYSRFPYELVPPVERKAASRCGHFKELPAAARNELAKYAVGLARSHGPTVIAHCRAALEQVEASPWGYIRDTIDDWGWARFNEGPGPGSWTRNALDAYARIRTAEVGLGRCTETTPYSAFTLRPLDVGHLDRAESLAEAILKDARERLEEYAARSQGDRRDWRKHAEDELFDEATKVGLSDRAAGVVACHLVVAAAKGLPVEDREAMKRRGEAARRRAERRRKRAERRRKR